MFFPVVSQKKSLAANLEETLALLRQLSLHPLSNRHPKSHPDARVKVEAALVLSPQELAVYFKVEEPWSPSQYLADGGAVYRDSCVELFVRHAGNPYLNFEVNRAGCLLAQRGKQREGRQSFAPHELRRVIRLAPTHRNLRATSCWEVALIIPRDLMERTANKLPESPELWGNLYKCGDALKAPHWMSYFPVPTERPDFHRPECFRPFVVR